MIRKQIIIYIFVRDEIFKIYFIRMQVTNGKSVFMIPVETLYEIICLLN